MHRRDSEEQRLSEEADLFGILLQNGTDESTGQRRRKKRVVTLDATFSDLREKGELRVSLKQEPPL